MATKLKRSGYTNINLDAGWNANRNWEFRTDANGHGSRLITLF
jgi:hypothetical protein